MSLAQSIARRCRRSPAWWRIWAARYADGARAAGAGSQRAVTHQRSSRERYRQFLQDYKQRRLDDSTEAGEVAPVSGRRREYLREYARWLWPYRYAVGVVFAVALVAAGLELIEPLFMRYIIDHVLLNTALAVPARLIRL